MKIVGRYYLLCDGCNWEFTGFAVPGTVSAKPTRKRRGEGDESRIEPATEGRADSHEIEELSSPSAEQPNARRKKKRIKVRY